MVDTINVEELVRVAGNIELEGEKFYLQASVLAADETEKKLFSELAAWEGEHYKTFNKLLDSVLPSEFDLVVDVLGEAALYLQAVIGGEIFAKSQSPEELVKDNSDGFAAIFKFAIEREKDSIVFYTALEKTFNVVGISDELNKIIGEEISHVRFLSNALKGYLKNN